LQGSRNICGGFKDKECFSAFAEFHRQVLFDAVDPELDLDVWSAGSRPDSPSIYAYLLLERPQQLELAEANMEGRAGERSWWMRVSNCQALRPNGLCASRWCLTIFLLDDDDVDSTAESCWIYGVPGIRYGATKGAHVIHGGNSPLLRMCRRGWAKIENERARRVWGCVKSGQRKMAPRNVGRRRQRGLGSNGRSVGGHRTRRLSYAESSAA